MKENRGKLAGTGKVFSFTLQQMLRTKSNVITAVIMLVAALLWMPLVSVFGGNPAEMNIGGSGLKTIYYVNDTTYAVDFNEIKSVDTSYEKVAITPAPFAVEDYETELGTDEALLYVHMFENDAPATPMVTVYSIDADDAVFGELGDTVRDLLHNAQAVQAGASQEQIDMLQTNYQVGSENLASFQEEEAGPDWNTQYMVQFIYAIVVMILGIFAASYIIRAIIEEKESKLVELLMVSVKPMALVVGKILAVMVYIFGLLLAVVICMVVSAVITGMVAPGASVAGTLGGLGISTAALQIHPMVLIAVLISLLLGYLTFSIISGIAGTSCSTMDDMQAANMNVMLVVLAGYMVSVFTINMPGTLLANVVSLIPVLSIFCAPAEYICGNIGIVTLVASWIIQAIVIGLLFYFCSSIYENLILYKGKKMKLGQMIHMAAANRKKEGR